MDISYIINELGEDRSNYYNSVAPPIMQTSIFCFGSVASMRESIDKESEIPFYTRGSNPTTNILRKKMAALESAEDALIFASGSAAVAAAVISNLESGDHVVCVNKPYSWTGKLLNNFLPRFSINTTMVDGTDPLNYQNAIEPQTRILYLESPNSITFELQDIEAVVKIAKKNQLVTILDNSYATPLHQTPIKMGVDIVVHSASKYLGGHSDIVAGVLCGNKKMIEKIFVSGLMTLGGIISPFNAWLLIRGLRTLPVRLERVAATTLKIANYLQKHPKVEKVLYPFLPTHPQYKLAKKQMKNGGGQFSILIKADNTRKVDKFCNALKRFLLACSWGGYESLVFPMSALYNTKGNYDPSVLPWNLIRFYIGLEEADVLIEDLKQAFEQI
ncbi:MAG: aminotransferase class I/II-fold pyridoxal phosphate-dependent enzyme [Cytophagales bacterium]|nr:aminotransferase class I/II-fold pyridoxal phosphate-dependent enzyme [Cytophagales bacterium]